MQTIIVSGVIISLFGLIGLISCIFRGIKIKRFERCGTHSQEELKKLLSYLYIWNMASLGASFIGLLALIVGITLNS